jgi:hypothetical protein
MKTMSKLNDPVKRAPRSGSTAMLFGWAISAAGSYP